MSDHDDFGAFLVGFVVGGLTGAVVALLLAPQSGEETRAVIKEKAIELYDQAEKTADEVVVKGKAVADEAAAKGKEVAAQAKEKVTAGLSTAKQRVSEKLGRAQVTLEEERPAGAEEAPAASVF